MVVLGPPTLNLMSSGQKKFGYHNFVRRLELQQQLWVRLWEFGNSVARLPKTCTFLAATTLFHGTCDALLTTVMPKYATHGGYMLAAKGYSSVSSRVSPTRVMVQNQLRLNHKSRTGARQSWREKLSNTQAKWHAAGSKSTQKTLFLMHKITNAT